MSKVILLNGVGSSGKTSIARSIQHLSSEQWLTFGIDTFIEMTPYPAPSKNAEYFDFTPGENSRGPTMKVESKDNGKKLFGAMADVAALLANRGNNLIIDEVLLDDPHLQSYVEKLHDHTVYFIGVYCNLSIMQEREFLRGNRVLGLSNDQYDRVHNGIREYDLTVDTSNRSIFEIAQAIITFIDAEKDPQGFYKMSTPF
jgi:chloramphenicol 3-O phosphotransferase